MILQLPFNNQINAKTTNHKAGHIINGLCMLYLLHFIGVDERLFYQFTNNYLKMNNYERIARKYLTQIKGVYKERQANKQFDLHIKLKQLTDEHKLIVRNLDDTLTFCFNGVDKVKGLPVYKANHKLKKHLLKTI